MIRDKPPPVPRITRPATSHKVAGQLPGQNIGKTSLTVFVVMDVRDDISPALKFGQLRYVNRYYIHGDELERSSDEKNTLPREYLRNMDRCVADFNPRADYLLIAGDHLQLLALTALLVGRYGFLDVLRYDRQFGEYIPVRLHSDLVPTPSAVISSGTDIGEDNAESRREENPLDQPSAFLGLGLEAPLTRRDPRKRDGGT